MTQTYYKRNSANAICDVCGLKYKLDQLKKRWDGVWVCADDYEERHPQEFIRSKPDSNKLVIVKPRPPMVFTQMCTIQGRSGVVGLATVGCSIVGNSYTGPGGLTLLETGADVGYAIVGEAIVGNSSIFVWTDN